MEYCDCFPLTLGKQHYKLSVKYKVSPSEFELRVETFLCKKKLTFNFLISNKQEATEIVAFLHFRYLDCVGTF